MGGKAKKKKNWHAFFKGGWIFFSFFLACPPCPTPSFYYQTNLFTALFISKPSGIREGGGQGQKKKNWHAFFKGGWIFFFFGLAPLPHPFILLPDQFIYSFIHFSELKCLYLDTTKLQVVHSSGYNIKIVIFMNPAKPGPQGDAFCFFNITFFCGPVVLQDDARLLRALPQS